MESPIPWARHVGAEGPSRPVAFHLGFSCSLGFGFWCRHDCDSGNHRLPVSHSVARFLRNRGDARKLSALQSRFNSPQRDSLQYDFVGVKVHCQCLLGVATEKLREDQFLEWQEQGMPRHDLNAEALSLRVKVIAVC